MGMTQGARLEENQQWLQEALGQSTDVTYRHVSAGNDRNLLIVFVDGLTDVRMIQESVVQPLLRAVTALPDKLETLAESTLQAPSWTWTDSKEQALDYLLRGSALVFMDGARGSLLANTQGGESRSVETPQAEVAVRGPHDGFTEPIFVNRSLIRRRLVSPALRFELVRVGQTEVNIAYLAGLAPEALLAEVRTRLSRIKTRAITDAGIVAEWLEDSIHSPFPQIDHTERPDKVAAELAHGRVAVLVDQSPSVLLAPTVLWHLLHVPEDYYERWWTGSFIRTLRLLSLLLSLTLPGLWICLVAYHQELLPTPLALSLAGGRERVPVPSILEAFLLELAFEIIREAGVRLPRATGQAISIVGALVIGQTAVQAGLVSPGMIIIVAMTGLASFTTPSFTVAYGFRLLRFGLLALSGLLGVLGFGFGFMLIIVHLMQLKSFGTDYLSPVLPTAPGTKGDLAIRRPWPMLGSQSRRWWQP